MNFYESWKNNEADSQQFIKAFLLKSKDSIDSLENGTEEEMQLAFEVIEAVPFDDFFELMLQIDTSAGATTTDVPQFSSFEDGVQRLPELLEFALDGLTFHGLGYQLVKADKTGACVKYGENHSKLAKIMSLVTISKESASIVRSTAWGKLLVRYPIVGKEDVFRKLLMREYLLQKIISAAARQNIKYRDMVSCLSDSTATRRRSNVRYLIEYIHKGTNKEDVLKKIIW